MRVCSKPGCATIYPTSQGSQCRDCRAIGDKRRGTATQRGYTGRGHRGFRTTVLERDNICVLCNVALATVADHYPHSRKELIDTGMNPNDPEHGRGLCKSCHDSHTAQAQPGGWNLRD